MVNSTIETLRSMEMNIVSIHDIPISAFPLYNDMAFEACIEIIFPNKNKIQIGKYTEDRISWYMINHYCLEWPKYQMCSHILTAYTIMDMYTNPESQIRQIVYDIKNSDRTNVYNELFDLIANQSVDMIQHTNFNRDSKSMTKIRDLASSLMYGNEIEVYVPNNDPSDDMINDYDTSVANAIMKII
jgi:hypothetical protein